MSEPTEELVCDNCGQDIRLAEFDIEQIFTDPENQPHQFSGDYELTRSTLAEMIACVKAIHLDCPNWGKKPDGHYGPCGECPACRLRNLAEGMDWLVE